MTGGCSTRSTSSWRAGSGIVLGTVFLTSVKKPAEKCLLSTVPFVCVWCAAQISLSETDIPMSVGIVEPKTHPSQLNAAEFLWDMNKRTSVFVQVTKKKTSSHSLTTLALLSPAATCTAEFPHQTASLDDVALVVSAGALHQHGVHSQEAWRREGRPVQDPDRHVYPGRRWRVHRAPPLCFLSD